MQRWEDAQTLPLSEHPPELGTLLVEILAMSMHLVEQLTGQAGIVLFLAPSITLVSQTLREWTVEALERFDGHPAVRRQLVGQSGRWVRPALAAAML
jgi:hypothetical protein